MSPEPSFYSPITSLSLVEGTYLSRPNRFSVTCLVDGMEEYVFMPNPGRMRELLLPGVMLILADHGPQANRKTRYTVMAVRYRERIVFLHTHLNNLAARNLVEGRAVPGLRYFAVAGSEMTVGPHRFDLLLRDTAADLYLEVKSCTLSANGIAMFPDAVTERGRRHLLALAQMHAEGKRGALLFLIHHGNARAFLPDYHTDFAFAKAFCDVKDRLPVLAVALEWTPDLRFRVSNPRVIIPWDTIRTECVDCGHLVCVARGGTGYRITLTRYSDELSRKLVMRMRTRTRTRAGRADRPGRPGRAGAVYPVRSSIDASESMAGMLSGLYGNPSEDADGWTFRCATDPVPTPEFQEALLDFRMPRRLRPGSH
ncbi:MAG: DNA/RNA nuclease SfsA [Gemmatimonadetes bacterium]|nr:DNA/RNA nuclease SfsA [Gemmatimonadota bacterium]MYD25598.1 DNA/RNA nuclease SfsA [Gemmatimonadota bacterium]MYI98973.1 DNA/RNA nuclease SfsA [Gemmatimonadota bacterium]